MSSSEDSVKVNQLARSNYDRAEKIYTCFDPLDPGNKQKKRSSRSSSDLETY